MRTTFRWVKALKLKTALLNMMSTLLGLKPLLYVPIQTSLFFYGVSWAEFSLTEPIPLQAVNVDLSQNPRLLYRALITNTRLLTQNVLPPLALTSSKKSTACNVV